MAEFLLTDRKRNKILEYVKSNYSNYITVTSKAYASDVQQIQDRLIKHF